LLIWRTSRMLLLGIIFCHLL